MQHLSDRWAAVKNGPVGQKFIQTAARNKQLKHELKKMHNIRNDGKRLYYTLKDRKLLAKKLEVFQVILISVVILMMSRNFDTS